MDEPKQKEEISLGDLAMKALVGRIVEAGTPEFSEDSFRKLIQEFVSFGLTEKEAFRLARHLVVEATSQIFSKIEAGINPGSSDTPAPPPSDDDIPF